MKKRATPLPATERRALSVQTVLKLANERSPVEITTEAIAASMGLTQAALFRHFPTKEALWQEALQWATGELYAAFEEAARRAESPPEALERIYHTHLDFVSKNPGVPRILFLELQNPAESVSRTTVREMLSRCTSRLEEIIASGIANGSFDEAIDARSAATMFIGMLQGRVMQAMIAGNGNAPNANPEKLFNLFLRSITQQNSLQ
jgi:AcrR family transcriptional regulator